LKLRCELSLGGISSKIILAAKPEEKPDHLAMKLAAYAMFLPSSPIVEPSADHPSLADFDHKPDVMTIDLTGEIQVWIECGAVTITKLNKLLRRMPNTRLIVLKTTRHEAEQLRTWAKKEIRHEKRLEIWTWPEGAFQTWLRSLEDKTELFGDAHEKSFNLVINHLPYSVDLISV
jgi:uncharacterized protein YaeQ